MIWACSALEAWQSQAWLAAWRAASGGQTAFSWGLSQSATAFSCEAWWIKLLGC